MGSLNADEVYLEQLQEFCGQVGAKQKSSPLIYLETRGGS